VSCPTEKDIAASTLLRLYYYIDDVRQCVMLSMRQGVMLTLPMRQGVMSIHDIHIDDVRQGVMLTRQGVMLTRQCVMLTRQCVMLTRQCVMLTRQGVMLTRQGVMLTRRSHVQQDGDGKYLSSLYRYTDDGCDLSGPSRYKGTTLNI